MKIDVIEGIKQYPIKAWLDEMLRREEISEKEYHSILSDENKKSDKLISARKLLNIKSPLIVVINGNEFNKNVLTKKVTSLRTSTYNLRLAPKTGSNLPPFRIHGLTLEEILRYIKDRISQINEYTIFISEHFKSLYSGTIISKPNSMFVELVKGQHLHLTQGGKKRIYHGIWQGYRMDYDTSNVKIKNLIWKSVMNIIINNKYNFSPLDPPIFAKGYFEFIYDTKLNFILTDYSRHRFLSGLYVR